MRVWSDELDYTRLRKTEWELVASDRQKVKLKLIDGGDGSFKASFELANLPSNATSWRWKAKLEEGRRDKFNPATKITVE